MISITIKNLITDYPDFPKEGIIFKDISPIFQNPEAFKEVVKSMANMPILKKADAIIAIDARGFILGSAISFFLTKPMIFARKPGKLPGDLISKSYNLEYGSNSLYLQKNALKKFESFAIVDDLLATGGTAKCVFEILKDLNKKIEGLSVLIELKELNGRANLKIPVDSLITF